MASASMAASFSKLRLLALHDHRAARMAALIMRETVAVVISRFFIMAVEKEFIVANRGEELNS